MPSPVHQPPAPPVPVRAAAVGACPLCGGAAEPAFTAYDRNREISPQPFRYRRCLVCGAYSLVDVPEDLGPFYPAEYYELLTAEQLAEVAWVEQHKVDLLARHGAPGRLVEIGPGPGVFAYAAQRAGHRVTAIEMDERASRQLRDVVGIDAITSADPAAVLATERDLDAIALWHVIEHLPDPWAVLTAAAASLRRGGVLAIAAPNPDSIQFRLLGARWAHVDAPRHLSLIPLATLTATCSSLGLRRVEATTSDPAGRHWNRFGWERALHRRPAAGPAPRAVATVALAATLALRPLEHRGLRGAAYTAVFVKE